MIAYHGTVAEYLVATGEDEAAWRQLEMLQSLAPAHPQVRRVARQLLPGPLRRLLGALCSRR